MASDTGTEECGVEYNTEMCQGSTFSRTFKLFDSANAPIDVSADTFASQMRLLPSSSSITLTFTCTVGGVDNNEVTITASNVLTAAVPVPVSKTAEPRPTRDYYYDVERTSGAVVTKIAYGTITVHPEVTK